jgi:hypothetical protein
LRRDTGLPVPPIALFLRVGLDGIGWDAYEEQVQATEAEQRRPNYDVPLTMSPEPDQMLARPPLFFKNPNEFVRVFAGDGPIG